MAVPQCEYRGGDHAERDNIREGYALLGSRLLQQLNSSRRWNMVHNVKPHTSPSEEAESPVPRSAWVHGFQEVQCLVTSTCPVHGCMVCTFMHGWWLVHYRAISTAYGRTRCKEYNLIHVFQVWTSLVLVRKALFSTSTRFGLRKHAAFNQTVGAAFFRLDQSSRCLTVLPRDVQNAWASLWRVAWTQQTLFAGRSLSPSGRCLSQSLCRHQSARRANGTTPPSGTTFHIYAW